MAGSIDYVSFPCFTYERMATLPDIFGLRLPLTSIIVAVREYVNSIRPAVTLGMCCPIGSSKKRLRSWLRLHKHNPGTHVRLENEVEHHEEDHIQQASPPADSASSSSQAITITEHQSRQPPASTTSKSNSSSSAATTSHIRTSSFSLASILRKLRHSISNSFQRHKHPQHPPTPSITAPETHTHKYPSSQTSLTATLDSIVLSPPELNNLRRMELICHAANAARDRRSPQHQTQTQTRHQTPVYTPSPSTTKLNLRLRGGGDEPPFRRRRPRTTLLSTPPPPPAHDSTRPGGMLWWLAGGRVSQHGRVPTVGELRARREVEAANRRQVGFWGTVVGWRGVGRVGVLGDGGDGGEGEGGGDGGEGGGGDAASVRSNVGSGLKDGGGGENGDAEAARSKAGSALGEDGVAAEREDGGGENGEGKNSEGDESGEDGPGAAAKNI